MDIVRILLNTHTQVYNEIKIKYGNSVAINSKTNEIINFVKMEVLKCTMTERQVQMERINEPQ